MADRAGQAVEPDDNQSVAAADLAEDPSEHRPVAVGTGGLLLVNRGAPGGAELVGLGIGALIFGGDAGVADQAAGGGGKGRGHGAPGVATSNFTVPQGVRKWPFAEVAESPS